MSQEEFEKICSAFKIAFNQTFNKNETEYPKETNDDDDEKDDNIDAAKIWARQQKQSLAK